MRIAYFGSPGVGGTYSVFLLLRQGLARFGHDVWCVDCGEGPRSNVPDGFDEEGHVFLGIQNVTPAEQTEKIIRHIEEYQYGAVIISPGDSYILTNIARYLPDSVSRVAILHTMTRGVYHPTRLVVDHLDRVVAISDRIFSDLTEKWHIARDKVATVFHGVDVRRFPERQASGNGTGPLRLLFLGRIERYAKGIFYLPLVLEKAIRRGVDLKMDIIGEGPDGEPLRQAFKARGLSGFVNFVGVVSGHDVPGQVMSHDVFVMPSRYEGCGIALQEAMAGGCVPVATRIRGASDVIIEDGVSGFVCAPEVPGDFASRIEILAENRDLLQKMSRAARNRIHERFSLDQMAQSYARIFQEIGEKKSRESSALPMSDFFVDPGLRPTWRTRVPVPVKAVVRKWAERFGISV